MSSVMYWRPRPQPTPTCSLSFELKKILARRYWDHDGSLGGAAIEFDRSGLEYLRGLADAGVPTAEDLVDAIGRYEVVEVWIES